MCNDLEQADLPTPDVYSFTAPRSLRQTGLKTNIRRSAACELLVVWLLSADDKAVGMTTGLGWRDGARKDYLRISNDLFSSENALPTT